MSNYNVRFAEGNNNSSWNIAFGLIKPRTRVLDVGCSKGNFGKALIDRKQCTVDGIEPDEGDAKRASEVLNAVFAGPIEAALQLFLAGKKYDYLVFMDVIEHLSDPVSVLRGLSESLPPGGRIVFSIPNMAHVSVRLMLLSGELDYGKTGLLDNTHLHFYTKREIERVFSEAGYYIDELRPNEATYPRELVAAKVQEIGLEPTQKIVDLLSEESARIFQYVGTAMVASQAMEKQERVEYSPDPQGEITRLYEKKVSNLERALSSKESELAELRKRLKSTTN